MTGFTRAARVAGINVATDATTSTTIATIPPTSAMFGVVSGFARVAVQPIVGAETDRKSKEEPDDAKPHAAGIEQRHDLSRARAECHAHADLASPLPDAERDGAIESDRRQKEHQHAARGGAGLDGSLLRCPRLRPRRASSTARLGVDGSSSRTIRRIETARSDAGTAVRIRYVSAQNFLTARYTVAVALSM